MTTKRRPTKKHSAKIANTEPLDARVILSAMSKKQDAMALSLRSATTNRKEFDKLDTELSSDLNGIFKDLASGKISNKEAAAKNREAGQKLKRMRELMRGR